MTTADRRALRIVSRLERRSWRNWYLFLAVIILTTLGLGSAVVTLARGRISTPWPWVNTDLILIAGLAITVLLFAGYLTQQQRNLVALRRELLSAQEEAARRARSHYERLVALLGVSRVLANETDPQKVFDSITHTCLEMFECRQSALLLIAEEKQEFSVRSISGGEELSVCLARSQPLDEGAVGWVAKHRTPLLLSAGSDALPRDMNCRAETLPVAAMIVPILLRDQLLGVLSVSGNDPNLRYEEEDLQGLQVLAETAGVCCRHSQQTDWMRQTIQRLDATIQERGLDGSDWAA